MDAVRMCVCVCVLSDLVRVRVRVWALFDDGYGKDNILLHFDIRLKGCAICRWFAQLLPLIPFRFSRLISTQRFCYVLYMFFSLLLSHCIRSSIFDMFFFLFLFIFQMFLKGIVLIWFRFYWHCCRMASADIDRRIANGCTYM